MISDVISLPFLFIPILGGLEGGQSGNNIGSGGRQTWFKPLLYEVTGCGILDMLPGHLRSLRRLATMRASNLIQCSINSRCYHIWFQ